MKLHERIVLSLSVLSIAALAACKVQTKPAADPCPATYNKLAGFNQPGEKTCACAPDAPRGSVWGVGLYTQDSSICTAAVHAGVIGTKGGVVTLVPAAGCDAYDGSTANGVTSGSWGPFAGSFSFAGKNASCPKAAAAKPVAPPPPTTAATECPGTFLDIADRNDATTLTCRCAPNVVGSVWGGGTYTLDSSLCAAAVHAGVIGAAGGEITVKAAPGCSKYVGSAANGVTSNNWGSYQGSFVFPSKGAAACAS